VTSPKRRIVQVVLCPVGQPAAIFETDDELATLQRLVGGMLQSVRFEPRIDLWCNEEAAIRTLDPNRIVPGWGVIRGQFFFASETRAGNLASISAKRAADLVRRADLWLVPLNRLHGYR
jgi:hypothetical protein